MKEMRTGQKLPAVRRISKKQGLSLLDRRANAELGMSGSKFIRLWNKGKFSRKACDRPEVVRVAMLIPFAK
jgi:hypothetical protein